MTALDAWEGNFKYILPQVDLALAYYSNLRWSRSEDVRHGHDSV
jgi:hypothetical protein